MSDGRTKSGRSNAGYRSFRVQILNRISPVHFLHALIACVLIAAVAESANAEQSVPNAVLIYMDNVGYGDLGCYGNPVIRTPHVDQLAQQGVRCTDFYIVTSSCTPSRGALLTGRYPLRNGLTHQLSRDENWSGVGLPHSERILPQYFQAAGFATACFGKWNLGFAVGSRPTDRGFDEFFGCRSGNVDYFTHVYNGEEDLYRNTQPVDVSGYSTELFADAACDFIGRHQNEPFFVYVAFNAAHVPNPKNKALGQPTVWQAPARYFADYGYNPDSIDPHEGYHAVMSALDAGIGRILHHLDQLELAEKTIVVLASDNGASVRESLPLETGSNAPFRGGRTETYEGGIRTACVVRWPGRIPPGSVCREPVANIDILPFLLTASSIPLPGDRELDGRDIITTLAEGNRSPHQALYFQYRTWSAVRSGRWKVVRPRADSPFELYDLQVDWGETTNLAQAYPEICSALSQQFADWHSQF